MYRPKSDNAHNSPCTYALLQRFGGIIPLLNGYYSKVFVFSRYTEYSYSTKSNCASNMASVILYIYDLHTQGYSLNVTYSLGYLMNVCG